MDLAGRILQSSRADPPSRTDAVTERRTGCFFALEKTATYRIGTACARPPLPLNWMLTGDAFLHLVRHVSTSYECKTWTLSTSAVLKGLSLDPVELHYSQMPHFATAIHRQRWLIRAISHPDSHLSPSRKLHRFPQQLHPRSTATLSAPY
jgi:hypothetical protein